MFWTASGRDIVWEMHAHVAVSCLKTECIANLVIRKAVCRVLPGVLAGKKDALVIKAQCLQCRLYSKAVSSGLLVSWETEIRAVCSVWAWERNVKKPDFLFRDGSGKNASCPQSSFFQWFLSFSQVVQWPLHLGKRCSFGNLQKGECLTLCKFVIIP